MAQLKDAEGNNVSSPVKATMRARIVSGSQSVYPLSRTTSNTSSALGLISWCDAYSSKQQNEGVVFGADVNGNITYWTLNVVNVSSAGPPANLLPNITAAMMNQTLLPGAPPLKLAFFLQDAGGNPPLQSERVV